MVYQKLCLQKFRDLDIEDPIFTSLRNESLDDGMSFEEWFYQKMKSPSKMIVRYTDDKIDTVMAIRAEAQKIYMQNGWLKYAPRFKLELFKPSNISIASALLVAFCTCTRSLQSEFKQSYIVIPPHDEKLMTVLSKHIGFDSTGVFPDGKYLYLRNNAAEIPVLRANREIYADEVFPVVREAINDSLCNYYSAEKIKVRSYLI